MIREGFWGSIPGFFGQESLAEFLVGLIQVGILFGQIQINLKIRGSAGVSQLRSSENKVKPNLFQLFSILRLF